MANTKVTMLEALATALEGLGGVNMATRDLLPPSQQRENAPYVGMLAGEEENTAEDTTHILWDLIVDLICIVHGDDIEQLIDDIKDLIYDGLAGTIGAKYVHLEATGEVNVVERDPYSSVRLALTVTYSSEKGAA